MKEIGGYLQLEHFSGHEYYSDLLRLNLGRTALLYALEQLSVSHLYIPDFICSSVTDALKKWNGSISIYHTGHDFLPSQDFCIKKGAWLYLINYYGQLTNQQLTILKKRYGNIIVDNTHSFFQKPVPGIPALYSCRKFFGLPDGAYLYLPQKPADFKDLPIDSSAERMEHILGRFEHSASPYYQKMLETACSFCNAPIRQMSPLTRNLLQGIDYSAAAFARNRNYDALHQLLGNHQPKVFFKPEVPFVYPFYTPLAQSLRKQLAEYKIFIPAYWNNVMSDCSPQSAAYDFAANILPLPVDQRYDPEDMNQMATLLLNLLRRSGGDL